MRRNKSKETTFIFIAIFVLAFILAIFAIKIFPIPEEWKQLVFFTMISLVSGVGVYLVSRRKRG